MIEQKPIYFDKHTNIYYHKGQAYCDRCNKKTDKQFILGTHHTKRDTVSLFYCNKCFDKKQISSVVDEFKIVVTIKRLPKLARPLVIRRPELSNHKFTVFETDKIKASKTVDKTKYAGRESFKGASIGADVEDKPKIETQKDIMDELLELKEAKPIVPEMLEDESGG